MTPNPNPSPELIERARELLAQAYERADLICPATDVRSGNKIDWVREKVALDAILAALTPPTPAETVTVALPGAGEAEPVDDDEGLEAVADCFNGSAIYGRTEAWAEGKTLSVLFKETGQIAKLRFVKLVDKPSNADLRGEPA